MLEFDESQFDATLIHDAPKLAAQLADDIFGTDEMYEDMPFEVRQLLAEAAINEAKKQGMDTVKSIIGFVTIIVSMTPRFMEFNPFSQVMANSELSPDQRTDWCMSVEALPHWEPVLEHLEGREDWHLDDYWDERVDWNKVAHLSPETH